MKDELVGIEVAKLAKEKGFNEKCKFRFFEGKGELEEQVTSDRKSFRVMEVSLTHFREMEIHYTLRPTQSLLSRWLREVHGIIVCVENGFDLMLGYNRGFNLTVNGKNHWKSMDVFENYEEALEVGLFEGLKLIK